MAEKPQRRKRYSGTHPKKFAEKYKELNPEKYPGAAAHVRASGRTPAGTHVPILLAEVVEALAPQPGDVVLDCTLGYGGHTEALWQALRGQSPFSPESANEVRESGVAGRGQSLFSPVGANEVRESGVAKTGTVPFVAIDIDAAELGKTVQRLAKTGIRVSAHHTNFAGIAKVLAAENLAGVDCLLADLGVSSMQLDNPGRGFGFKVDGPLDMRMDPARGVPAAQLIADTDEEALAAMLHEFGDEQLAERIAADLKRESPATTHELSAIVLRAYGYKDGSYSKRGARDQHPAARVFQALRIAVNRETENLDHLLRTLPYVLNPGGRAAVITFHSGEERRVREALKAGLAAGQYTSADTEGVRPSKQELYDNPRSRSARLFVARR